MTTDPARGSGEQPGGERELDGQDAAGPIGRLGVLPTEPAPYQHLLRGPRRRWWKPAVALLVVLASFVVCSVLAFLPVVAAGAVAGIRDPLSWVLTVATRPSEPAGAFYGFLVLALLIVCSQLSIGLVHRVRPGYLSSVAGGLRWRWLLRCLAVVVPLWAIYLGGSALLAPPSGGPAAQWPWLLLIVVVLMPLQSAGEEYFFRGWILQNIGAWFRSPVVGLIAGTAVSVAAFSAAHGSPDVWIVASLGALAVTACLLTWWTGGLEAAIAIHVVNNVGVSVLAITFGGWDRAFIGASTTATPVVFVVSVMIDAAAFALITWQARRAGVQRHYQPAPSGVRAIDGGGSPGWPAQQYRPYVYAPHLAGSQHHCKPHPHGSPRRQ